MISAICLVFFLFAVFNGIKKEKDFLSPGKIFIIVWSLAIGLAELKFSRFQHDWSIYSWFILLLGISSLLLGVFISYIFFLEKKKLSISELRNNFCVNKLDGRKIFFANLILFFLYAISYLIEVYIEGYVPLFSSNIARARVDFGVFGLHLLVNNQVIIMFLCIELIVLFKLKKTYLFLNWIVFFSTLMSYFLLLQRFNLFIWAVATFSIIYYGTKKINWKTLTFIGGIFYGFLYIIQSIRVSQYVTEFVYVVSAMKFPKKYAVFSEPYMYITMNLENFTRSIDKIENFTFGFLTFDWIVALTGLKSKIIEYFNIVERPFLNSSFNTFPFLWNYYSDFGVIGIFIFPLISGIIIGCIYYKLRLTGSIKYLMLYSFSLVLLVISFFTNPLTMLNFIFNIIILIYLHSYRFLKSDY